MWNGGGDFVLLKIVYFISGIIFILFGLATYYDKAYAYQLFGVMKDVLPFVLFGIGFFLLITFFQSFVHKDH